MSFTVRLKLGRLARSGCSSRGCMPFSSNCFASPQGMSGLFVKRYKLSLRARSIPWVDSGP